MSDDYDPAKDAHDSYFVAIEAKRLRGDTHWPERKDAGMKNRLTDLNDHLFAQMERLSDEELTPEQIESEVQRTDAIVKVADKIVDNARLNLQACELVAKHGDRFMKHLPMIAPPAAEAKT